MKYQIKEIFGPTIQGEGTYTGEPCMFVRFSRCNRWDGKAETKAASICHYCDTDFVGGDLIEEDDLITQLDNSGLKSVVLTGGEPMLQIRNGRLVDRLLSMNYLVMVETNGSIPWSKYMSYDDNLNVTVSPKQLLEQTILLGVNDIKVLFPYIHPEITAEDFRIKARNNIYIQPIDGATDFTEAAFAEVVRLRREGMMNVRLSIQTHKLIGFQ